MTSKSIQYLLFDVDETLLDFKHSEQKALCATFEQFGYRFEEPIKSQYHAINSSLWIDLEKEKITLPELGVSRFRRLFENFSMQKDPARFNQAYMENLSHVSILVDGADTICRLLNEQYLMSVVTNGVSFVQKRRLMHSGLSDLFSHIFVSEDVGYAKPALEFFDYVFEKLPPLSRESVLIIGDSLSSDMKGGHEFGIQTCWFNPHSRPNNTSISVTYEIRSLLDLPALLQ